MHNRRSAEQRWPAESKADDSTSPTTCSASADESTTMAFCPPVSAIKGMQRPCRLKRCDKVCAIRRATSVEPVNMTPATCGFAVSYTHLRAHETGRNLVCRLLL